MRTDLGKLSADWAQIRSVALYGAGEMGHLCKSLFERLDLDIPFVIDQDVKKQGNQWLGRPIISYEEAKPHLKGKKLVVMTGHAAYGKIVEFLNQQGLTEFVDFCNVGQFMSDWLWSKKQMNCVYHVDMTVTTKCTLNCRHCNLFIPYQKKHVDFAFAELKRNIDLFFQRVDFVTEFGMIGGETFLNPCLEDIIVHLGEHYREQIGRIWVTTNGTVMPPESLFRAIKKYNVHMSISDYTKAVPYGAKVEQLVAKAQEWGIDYQRNPSIVWTNFGFPDHPVQRSKAQLEKHLSSCRPDWNGLHNGRFYYCNVSCCAELSGHFKLQPTDYIDLETIDPADKVACRKIVELSRGTSSFCRICGGCGADNTNYVPTGVQMGKRE